MLFRLLLVTFAIAAPYTAVAVQDLEAKLQAAAKGIEEATGYVAEPGAGPNYCLHDKFCEAFAGEIQVQAHGLGVVTLLTTTRESQATYRDACAGAFAGLSGSDYGFSRELVAEAFAEAAINGRFRRTVAGVELSVSPSLDDLLECRLFKR